MDKYKMTSLNTDIKVYYSIEEAIAATEDKIRVDLQGKRLKTMPKGFEALAKIPYLELDLSYNTGLQIDSVLEQLKQLPNLRGLALMRIEFGALPSSIGDLVGLETLMLVENKMSDMPMEFSKLRNLKYLCIKDPLKFMPNAILFLSSLESFELCCEISQLEDIFFENMKNLKELRLDCYISMINPKISLLKNLTKLVIKSPNCDLSNEIKTLKNLEYFSFTNEYYVEKELLKEIYSELLQLKELHLSDFDLTEIPDFVFKMKNLEVLNLSYNKIITIPEKICNLTKLRELDIGNNAIIKFPLYLGDLPDLTKINFDSYPKFDLFDFFQQCKKGKYKSYEHRNLIPKLTESGKYFGFKPDFEEITIRIDLFPTFLDDFFELKKLKKLNFSNYGAEQKQLEVFDLPDIFDKYPLLESLNVWGINSIMHIPPTLYVSKTIQQISLPKCLSKIDFEALRQMSQLESLSLYIDDDDIEKLPLLKNISRLYINNPNIRTLPEGMKKLVNLKSFGFPSHLNKEDEIEKLPYLEEFYADDVFDKLYGLKHLKSVTFNDATLSKVADFIEKNESIKHLEVRSKETVLSSNLHILNKLEKCELCINAEVSFVPIEFALVNPAIFKNYFGSFAAKNIQLLHDLSYHHFENDKQKILAFALTSLRYEEIRHWIENPFQGSRSLENFVFYIFGIPTLFEYDELCIALEKRGASVSKQLDNTVTHIFWTSEIVVDIEQVIKSEIPIVLEEDFKKHFFAEEIPFLMQEANAEMTNQITRLLKQYQDKSNWELMLSLIEGGGANKIILSYLFALHLYHNDDEIKNRATKLFKKYATSNLLSFIAIHWSDHYHKSNESGEDITLFYHEDLDVFSCILATKLIGKQKSNAIYYGFDILFLRNYTAHSVSSTINELDFISNIIYDVKSKNLFDFANVVHFPNLKEISINDYSEIINNKNIFALDAAIFQIKSLEELNLNSLGNKENPIKIPHLSFAENLKYLKISSSIFEDIENLKSFISKLKRLKLIDTNIIDQIQIFEVCTELEQFECMITAKTNIKLNLDVTKLKKLEYRKLKNCFIEYDEDLNKRLFDNKSKYDLPF